MQLKNFPQWQDMPADWLKPGDWLDTLGFPGAATVRFKPERFSGSALMVRKGTNDSLYFHIGYPNSQSTLLSTALSHKRTCW